MLLLRLLSVHSRSAVLLVLLSLSLSTPTQAASGPLLSHLVLAVTPVLHIARPAATAQVPSRSTALDYADTATLDANLSNSGQWSTLGDSAVWRLRLNSPDALNLSLTLAEIALPSDAQLRLYDADGLLWHGPISAATLSHNPRFWTPLVPGENVVLELRIPRAQQATSQLRVVALHHGYRSWNNTSKSGSCNVDVACSTANAWTDAVQATARISIGGRRLCSAVLLNNTSQNGDPLVLTAQHCGIGSSEDLGADSVVVYWNYESKQCGGSANGNLGQNQSGAQLLAQGSQADFSLIRLNQKPAANYQVYYAGWDANGLSPSRGVSVHHPSGDEKSISFFNQRANRRTANVDGAAVQSWEVFWDQGVTESGSSGAGLWDQAHRVVGQLSGGNSSCSNQGSADVYGRLDVAWQEASARSGQLKAWLDPSNTGNRAMDGADSSSGVLKANEDNYTAVPDDSTVLSLDVLLNDAGTPPLQIISSHAQQGHVSSDGQRLLFRFADGSDADTLEYQIVDRWGDTQTAKVHIAREKAATAVRGGALTPWLSSLLLLAAVLRQARVRPCRQ